MKKNNNYFNCKSCNIGYELFYLQEQDRYLCKLAYELENDLYSKIFEAYYEKYIFAIKMLHSPIENEMICKKNEYIIFYFEWLFDLYGNQPFETKLILNEETIKSSPYEYSLLTESNAKKLNFSRLKIYVEIII